MDYYVNFEIVRKADHLHVFGDELTYKEKTVVENLLESSADFELSLRAPYEASASWSVTKVELLSLENELNPEEFRYQFKGDALETLLGRYPEEEFAFTLFWQQD